MPYIAPHLRTEVDNGKPPESVGELTYLLYCAVKRYVSGKTRYQEYAEAIAALESAKLEFYRRVVERYENSKIEQNGDV